MRYHSPRPCHPGPFNTGRAMPRHQATLALVIGLLLPAAAQQGSPGSSDAKPPAEDRSLATKPPGAMGVGKFDPVEVLTDTQGVDFKPYVAKVLDAVRRNWYNLIPIEARPPELRQGKVTIEFAILPNGKVAGMRITSPSDDIAMDRAAWGGITASVPFDPLPEQFHGPYLGLRFRFCYNPPKASVQASKPSP